MASKSNTQKRVNNLRQKFDESNQARSNRPEAAKSANFLVAIALNAFNRSRARKPLTALEQYIVDLAKKVGLDDEDIAAFGETYTSASPAGLNGVFTERFATLNAETGYSIDDLRADLPKIAPDVVKNPNVRMRHPDLYFPLTPHNIAGTAVAREGKEPTEDEIEQSLRTGELIPEGEREPGYSVTTYAVPLDADKKPRKVEEGIDATRSIVFGGNSVHCRKETSEVGKDEPFFGFSTSDGVRSYTHKSDKFSMRTGQWSGFPGGTPYLWRKPIEGSGITMVVDGWEADNSDAFKRLGPALIETAKYLIDELVVDSWDDLVHIVVGEAYGGIPTWITVLTLGVVLIIYHIFGGNPDDHMGTHTVNIPTQVLLSGIPAHNPYEWMVDMDHRDENHGHYNVYCYAHYGS